MKKLLSIGLLTVCVLAFAEDQAQAWVNSKFSIGLSWNQQSGNTSYLWGLWRNGQVPGPEGFAGGPGVAPGVPSAAVMETFPYYGLGIKEDSFLQGNFAQGAPQAIPQGTPRTLPREFFSQAPRPAANAAQQPIFYNANVNWAGNPYQATGYQRNGYNYYQPSYYYYPASPAATNTEEPFMWYGPR